MARDSKEIYFRGKGENNKQYKDRITKVKKIQKKLGKDVTFSGAVRHVIDEAK